MAAKDPGKLFIADIVAPTIDCVQNPQNDDVPDVENFDNDASAFTNETVWIVRRIGTSSAIPQPDQRTKRP